MSHETRDFGFDTGSLVGTDKYIEFADGNLLTAKQTGEVQITMYEDNGKPFIYTLYNILFAPDLCDQLFSIVTLINLGHTCLFHKWFCMILFRCNNQIKVTLTHSAQQKPAFLVKTNEKLKPQKEIPKMKGSLELFHQRLGQGPQGHYCMKILQMSGKILISRYILTLYAHHVRSQQSTPLIDQIHL